MARLSSKEKKKAQELLELYYVDRGITNIDELALKVKKTGKTIRKWITELKLDKYKKNIVLTRSEQLRLMLEELEQINASIREKPDGARFADFKLAQVRRQLIKDIKDLETKALVSEHVNSLTVFIDFVKKENTDDALKIGNYANVFIKKLLN